MRVSLVLIIFDSFWSPEGLNFYKLSYKDVRSSSSRFCVVQIGSRIKKYV